MVHAASPVSAALVVRAWYEDGHFRARLRLLHMQAVEDVEEELMAGSIEEVRATFERWLARIVREGGRQEMR